MKEQLMLQIAMEQLNLVNAALDRAGGAEWAWTEGGSQEGDERGWGDLLDRVSFAGGLLEQLAPFFSAGWLGR